MQLRKRVARTPAAAGCTTSDDCDDTEFCINGECKTKVETCEQCNAANFDISVRGEGFEGCAVPGMCINYLNFYECDDYGGDWNPTGCDGGCFFSGGCWSYETGADGFSAHYCKDVGGEHCGSGPGTSS